jgi:pimeloyl-ACP methyl ester carboxylesterase
MGTTGMPYIVSGKVKRHFEENGHGYPVIILHEFESDSCAWDLQVRHFARNHRCITYSARGFPPSDVPEELTSYGWKLSVEDVAAVMRGLAIPRAHLVGSNTGGYAALQFCLRYPEKASAIVATATGYGSSPSGRQNWIRRTVALRRESNAAMPDGMKLQSINNCVTKNGPAIGGSSGYYTLYPRGRGASEGPIPDGYAMVSRWASPEEAGAWLRNGGTAIQSEIGGDRVYVTLPGAPQPGGTGPVRIDFAVPQSALIQAANAQWRRMMQPIQSTPIYNVTITVPNGITLPK